MPGVHIIIYKENKMINKETFNAVMGNKGNDKKEDLIPSSIHNNTLTYLNFYCGGEINLDTLNKKCKNWLNSLEIGVMLEVHTFQTTVRLEQGLATARWAGLEFKEDTELEAVIKACEYIMTQKDKIGLLK